MNKFEEVPSTTLPTVEDPKGPEAEKPAEKEIKELTLEQQQEIIERLRVAKKSEERIKAFASIMDDFGADALIGLIPELGDAAPSVVSGMYLLFEAKKAGMSKADYLKIISLQAADFAVGFVPLVGDVADYFHKANKKSVKFFEKNVEEIKEEARKLGISEEQIAMIEKDSSKLPKLTAEAVRIYSGKKREEQVAA